MFEEASNALAEVGSNIEETRGFIKWGRRITRRKYTPEEKIHIVLEGFRREIPIRDLCRCEVTNPSMYYTWSQIGRRRYIGAL